MKQQPAFVLEHGTKVTTNAKLNDTSGLIIHPDILTKRRPNAKGAITGIGGYGGDLYWIMHTDGSSAVYSWEEFELEEPEHVRAVITNADLEKIQSDVDTIEFMQAASKLIRTFRQNQINQGCPIKLVSVSINTQGNISFTIAHE